MKNLKRIIIVTLVAIIMSMATTFAGPKLPSGYWYYDQPVIPNGVSNNFEDMEGSLSRKGRFFHVWLYQSEVARAIIRT